jgi:hypothetical protein
MASGEELLLKGLMKAVNPDNEAVHPTSGGGSRGADDFVSQRNFTLAMDAAGDPASSAVAQPEPTIYARRAVERGGEIPHADPSIHRVADGGAYGSDTAASGHGGAGLERAGRARSGDAILDGMQQVRRIFDARIDGTVRSAHSPSVFNVHDLFEAQRQVAEYALTGEVASKLVNKAATTADTLLKG